MHVVHFACELHYPFKHHSPCIVDEFNVIIALLLSNTTNAPV